MAQQTQSRTQMVRAILLDLGTETDAQDIIDEMQKRYKQTCHSSLVYAERKRFREEQAEARRKQRPQPVQATASPVVPSAVSPPPPAAPPPTDLQGFTAKAKRVKEFAEEVGGYDNLITLAEFLRGLTK
jgi:hypothetical protein